MIIGISLVLVKLLLIFLQVFLCKIENLYDICKDNARKLSFSFEEPG